MPTVSSHLHFAIQANKTNTNIGQSMHQVSSMNKFDGLNNWASCYWHTLGYKIERDKSVCAI